jgi:hypothetical protein
MRSLVSFVDDVVNAINNYTFDGVEYIERKLAADKAVARNAQLQTSVTEGSAKVLEQLQTAIDVNCDKFELYVLQNILKVPDRLRVLSLRAMQIRLIRVHRYQLRRTQLDVRL